MLLHPEIFSIFTKMMVWLLRLNSLGFGEGRWLAAVCELGMCLLRLQILCICLLAYSLFSVELCRGKPLSRKLVCSQYMCVYRSLQSWTMFMARSSQVLNSSVSLCSLWSVDTPIGRRELSWRQQHQGVSTLWVRKGWMHVPLWKWCTFPLRVNSSPDGEETHLSNLGALNVSWGLRHKRKNINLSSKLTHRREKKKRLFSRDLCAFFVWEGMCIAFRLV